MSAFLRIFFLAPLAYVLACTAAAAVIVFALVRGFQPPPVGVEIFAMMLPATIATGAVAILPALVAIVLAEAFGWRSLFYWLAVGGLMALVVIVSPGLVAAVQAVALFVIYIAWVPRPVPLDSLPVADFVTTVLAAGFVGGFVYWVFAGRWSGMGGMNDAAPPAPPAPREGTL